MATVVSVDTQSLSLERYEIGGSAARRTHSCDMASLAETLPAVAKSENSAFKLVQLFRLMPDPKFIVEPPPPPTNPPASAGAIQLQRAA